MAVNMEQELKRAQHTIAFLRLNLRQIQDLIQIMLDRSEEQDPLPDGP